MERQEYDGFASCDCEAEKELKDMIQLENDWFWIEGQCLSNGSDSDECLSIQYHEVKNV